MLPNINTGNLIDDCLNFLPELLACGGIVLFLLIRLFDRSHMGTIALGVTLIVLGVSVSQWYGSTSPRVGEAAGDVFQGTFRPAFGGLLVYDHVTIFLRCFLYGFTALIIWLSLTTGIPDREDSPDFYCLLLGATVGMVMMASATHLLMVYIGIEMASLPSYALAGYLKGRRASSEAALKYVVYGGGAAGVMLYGISLLAGRFGTAYLPDVAVGLMHSFYPPGGGVVFDPVLILALLFILIGVAFKLAAVPFHFWCPDVFEGASAEVAGYLSVASKGAALALLGRLTLFLGGVDSMVNPTVDQHWDVLVRYLVPVLAFFAALTATFGNLAAYLQNNLKRLLAYSTIAHAGYMMMGLAALQPPAQPNGAFQLPGLQAVLFYLVAYLFMNLGAFAVVAFLRNQTGSEELEDFRGLVRRSPWMVVTLSIFLLSLLGLPPLVGFTAKFQIFSVLWNTSQAWYHHGNAGLGATLFGLLVIGGVNSVLSAVYYIKVMKVMILEGRAEDLEGREPVPLREPISAIAFSFLMALVVFVLGILWAPLDRFSHEGTDRFVWRPGAATAGPPGGGMGAPRGGQRRPRGGRPGPRRGGRGQRRGGAVRAGGQ
ncbi:MAG TPA: NADH-quinone oxidoreductase subunit N [Gemmataceae bacterium]|nr:NADH-quinone oxidoreductase subunit N [Gemmataceae bacterium]